jgi:transposase InsO family protein
MIEDIRQTTGHGIRQICASLQVPRSSFYHAASPTPTQSEDCRSGDLIEAIFRCHRRRYGYRRIGEELSDAGEVCAPDRIRRIMRQRGLRAIQLKTYVPKTNDGRADKPSANLLLGQPLPASPCRPAPAGQARPGLGRGHHLHPHLRGLALSGRGHRPLLA